MKNTEFIELINLYLDHELPPADCARLEAEVKANPDSRRIYEQYCRMQKACKVLATDFAAEAPSINPRAIRASGTQGGSHRGFGGYFAIGSLAAAAACVALVVLSRGKPEAPLGASAVAEATAAAPVAAAVVADSAPRSGGIVQRSSLTGESVFLTRAPAAGEAVAPQLAWLTGVQLAPMQQVVFAEDLRFEAKLLKLNADARSINPLKKAGDNVKESAAFEFRP